MMLSADALALLRRDGHVRLQAKFMPPQLAKDALHLFRSGHCKDGAAGRGRGDKVVWLSLASIPETLPALSNAFTLLMSIVCELEEQLSEGLFVPLYCQFAAYEGDGVACYPPHRDNSPLPDGQDWLNDRTYTVLCYLNEDWSTADEGELRIHPLASDAERTRLEWNGAVRGHCTYARNDLHLPLGTFARGVANTSRPRPPGTHHVGAFSERPSWAGGGRI